MHPAPGLAPDESRSGEWQELRAHLRHQTVEVLRLIAILLQDAVILLAGFVAEFAYERWLHSSEPFFQLAVSLSSALFLLLYGITVTVHIVNYVRGQFGTTRATLLGQYLPWALAGVGVIAAAVAVTVPGFHRERPTDVDNPAAHAVMRFEYPLPAGQKFTRSGRHVLAISPDGTKLAYVANHQLYLRVMDQIKAKPVPGTNEDPEEPVFSPDGQWLAYFVPGAAGASSLKKIAVAGGAPVTLAQLPGLPYGATWRNGTIIVGINRESAGALAVPDSGGAPRTIVTRDPEKELVTQPQLLADGKHVLFVFVPLTGNPGGEGQIVVQTLDGKERRTLIAAGSDPRVLPAGQLVYIHAGTLLAVPFDIGRLVVTGGPVPLVEGVAETANSWAGQFAISGDGTLAFSPGAPGGGEQRLLVWVDRQGHEEPVPAKPRAYIFARLSPDGTRIAVSSSDEENDVWVFDLARNTLTRLTLGATVETHPAWMPDNKNLLYSSSSVLSPASSNSPSDIFRQAADGTGAMEALTQHLQGGFPMSLSPDGKTLVFQKFGASRGLFVLPLEPKGEARALIADPRFIVNNGEISPDGRWIAYDSTESGGREVYVRPFPAVNSGRWQISPEGGADPVWARSGRELFFLTAAERMVAVPVREGTGFAYGTPQPLFDAAAYFFVGPRTFDISADGKRFLMIKDAVSGSTETRPSIIFVFHWVDEVKARMSAPR